MYDPHDPVQTDPTLLRDSIKGLKSGKFRNVKIFLDGLPVGIKPNSVLFEVGKGVGETKERSLARRAIDVNHYGGSATVTLRYYRTATDGERAWIEETNHPDLPDSWRRAREAS